MKIDLEKIDTTLLRCGAAPEGGFSTVPYPIIFRPLQGRNLGRISVAYVEGMLSSSSPAAFLPKLSPLR